MAHQKLNIYNYTYTSSTVAEERRKRYSLSPTHQLCQSSY